MQIVARAPAGRQRRAVIAFGVWLGVWLVVASGCSPAPVPPGPSAATNPPLAPSSPAAAGGGCVRPPAPAARDWNGRVWYEIFVRSFADGNGDGVGDFRGLTARLDYLNDGDPSTTSDLGVGGLWLMPIMESPSYHGYDVVDYRAVESDYGSSADFKAFLVAAHARGLKVILDLPLNHTSSDSPWFVESQTPASPRADWYIWATENPGYLGPDGQVVWRRLGDRWFYAVFSDRMPDLNLRNPAVTAELEAMARYWLVDVGVDGFRLDAAKYLVEDGQRQANTPETLAWLAGFHKAADAARPESLLVGEVWDLDSVAGRYVPGSVDLTFDFGLATGIRLAIQSRAAAPLDTALREALDAWPTNQQATFLTNHDQDRILSQLGGDLPSARLAAFTLMTAPGVPFLYYGEEIGMLGTKPDERIRAPMQWSAEAPAAGFSSVAPWEPLGEGWQSSNVAAETRDPASLLSTYRDAIALRTAYPALRNGVMTLLGGGTGSVIGWLRTTPGGTLLIVINLDTKPVDAYGLRLDAGPLCGPTSARLVATVGGDSGRAVAPPSITASGGFDSYQPLPGLAARSGYAIQLSSAP